MTSLSLTMTIGNQSFIGSVVPATVYDIILVASDSYGVGVNTRAGGDTLNAGVYQYNSDPTGARYRTITQDLPLYNPNASETGSTGVTNPLSIGETIANAHNTRTGNPTLIVPYSTNGTCLLSTGHLWQVGDTLHEGAITQANLAIAAAIAQYPGSKLVAIAVLDSGLANDAINYANQGTQPGPGTAIDKAATKTMLGTVIADFRSRITGASSVPILFHALPPEFIAAHHIATVPQSQPADFNDAIREYAAASTGIYFVDVPVGYSSDNLHLNNAGIRLVGPMLDAIMADTTAPTISTANTYSGNDGSPINITLAANEYVTWSTATSGWEIVRTFGTGGTGGINTAIPTYTLRLTSNANASYASPPANPVVVARDGAGNTSSLTITVSIAQPYGVGDQGPVTATYMGSASMTGTNFGAAPFTLNIPLGVGLNLLSFYSDAGSDDIVNVSVGGNTGARFVASGGSASGTVIGLVSAVAGTVAVTVQSGGGNGAVGDVHCECVCLTGTKASPSGGSPSTDYLGMAFRNPTIQGASLTCPTNGFIIGMSYIENHTAFTGATTLGGSGNYHAAKRTTTGAFVSNSATASYSQISSLVFEKSV